MTASRRWTSRIHMAFPFSLEIWVALLIFPLASAVQAQAQAQAQDPVPLLPDLAVVSIRLDPEFPEPNQIVDVIALLRNTGRADAGAFRVVFRVNGRIQSVKALEGLAAGEEVEVVFPWVARGGVQVLRIEADAFKEVEEPNEADNALERQIELTPDLIVQAVELLPEAPQPGGIAKLLITVANVGGRPTEGRAAVRVKDGRRVLATLFIDPLPPDRATQLEVSWRAFVGEHLLRVVADALGRITESDELNNTFTQIIDISEEAPTGADLSVRSIAIEPEPELAPNPKVRPGEPAQIRATVVNTGTGPASSFEVLLQVDGQEQGRVTVSDLAPGEARTVSWEWSAAAGERLIRVKADARGQVVEPEENDNVAVAFVDVGEPLNRCGQLVALEMEAEAMMLMADVLGLTEEAVNDVFLPKVKRAMEEDFEGVNIRFTLRRPSGRHSTVKFVDENRGSILGLAPLDFNNRSKGDTGTVFLGSFIAFGTLNSRSIDLIAQAIANTASHEVGHLLGLEHDSEEVSRRHGHKNLMAANNDSSSFFADAFFTEENLEYLRRILPLVCES